MLNAILTLDGKGEVSGRALADPDDEGALVLVSQQLLGVGTCDSAVVPVVRLHLDVIARNKTCNNKKVKLP